MVEMLDNLQEAKKKQVWCFFSISVVCILSKAITPTP